MKNTIRRIEALLLAILFVLNISPVSVLAESGEYEGGQLGLRSNPRPHRIEIQLEPGQTSITLQEIAEAAGEEYTEDLGMYYPKPDTIQFADNYKTLTNLNTIPYGTTGSVSIYDWAANDGDGEWAIYATLVPADARPYYVEIQLEEGQDTVTLEEIVALTGETSTNAMILWSQSPNTLTLASDYRSISNLTSLTGDQTGSVWVYDYDGGENTWAIKAGFKAAVISEKKYYTVTETGTFTQAEILDAAGVTESTYDNYYMIKDDTSADYSDYMTVSVIDHTVTFLTTELPAEGLVYKLTPNGGQPCPFKLVFIGDNTADTPNDGIFTYEINETAGTATVTGFVSGLSDAEKANITIPATMTWPQDGGTEYTVTGIAGRAFESDTNIQTVTIVSPVFTIGDYAFYRCTNLTEVHQTQGGAGSRLTIGEHVFDAENYNDSKLKSFTSEAGIDMVGAKAFAFTDKLELFTAGSNQKTRIGTNAFQNCGGEAYFNGGISDLGYISFYNTLITKLTTTSIDDSWYSISGWPNDPQIDLVLNVSAIDNGTLTDSVLTDNLLKHASGFKNITVNLQQGVTAVSADTFASFPFDNYVSLTVNIDTEENDAEITVAEGAVPADQIKLQVNFRVPRANVTGADTDPLPALEAIGRVTYLDAAPADNRLHDDLFWYTIEDGKAYIVGLYDETAADLQFTSVNQGDVYKADGTLMEGITLNVAGITSLSDEEKAGITSVTFDSSSAFSVGEGTLNEMPALETLAMNNGKAVLPEGAFADCTALESVVIGTAEDQTGTAAIPADAFDGCSALTSFTCNLNASVIPAGAFGGCAALETVSFTGKGSQAIESGAFSGAEGIKYLRVDNPYDLANGAFAVSGGTTFVQNNDAALNSNLASKIGSFDNYIFLNNPWWMNGNGLSGNNAPATVYFANSAKNLSGDLVSVIANAGSNLTDVYIDCAREDVSFADNLDEANPHVTIHYRENHITVGCYIDGVNGNDENDGSHDAPVKTFDRAKEVIAAMPTEPTEVADETMDGILADACPKVGVNATPGAFTDIIEPAPQAFVLNTVTVSGTETWDSGEGDPVILIRDPSFTGAMVDVTGSLTLKNVILDGNRTNVTAQAAMINAESGSTLTLDSGSVLRNNASPVAAWINSEWENGGAVFAKGATVNIKNGSLIDNNLAMYGGGVQMYGGTLNMTGGTVSNNTAEARKYNSLPVQGGGGGVILTHGAVMNLSGGTITGNYAKGYEYNSTIGVNGSTGGGIQVGASYNDLNSESKLNMTGGTVSNNTARAEGGGICIQDSCTATITAGQIINNQSLVDGGYVDSFGGGGIYVNAARAGTRNGLLKLNNALITDNEAYSGGGGIACCETVNLTLAMGNGAAIFGNHITGRSGEHDLLLFYRGYGSSPGTKAKLAFYMMNGAEYNWTHVVTQYDKDVYDCPFDNGQPVSEELIAYVNVGSVGCDLKLKSNPTNTSVNPKVIITGNKANAKGGGIGSNGNIVIGDLPPAGDVTMTPDVSKLVVGRDMKEGEEYTFSVIFEESVEEYTTVDGSHCFVTTYTDTPVGTGTVTGAKDNEAAKISLPGYTLSNVTDAYLGKKYALLVLEDTIDSDVLDADDGVYFAQQFIIGQGKDSTGKSCYKAYLLKTEKGTYTRNDDGTVTLEYGSFTKPGKAYPYHQRIRSEITGDPVFTNYPLDREASAEKLWQDEDGNSIDPAEGVTVTFALLADGEPARDIEGNDVPPVTLNGVADESGEAEAWKAFWTNLPIFSDAAHTTRIVYSAKETACSSDIYTCLVDEAVIPDEAPAQIVNVINKTQAAVRKIWDDADDQDGKRPESLTVTLSNGQSVTLDESNHWLATITDLPVYENGQLITYTWTEDTLPEGYTLKNSKTEGTITTLTNSYTPETVDLTVRKIWEDGSNKNSTRPASLTVTLLPEGSGSVTLSDANNWTDTIEGLPKYKDGELISYEWSEVVPENYKLTNTATEGLVTTLTNTFVTSRTVKKVWDDGENADNARPASLTVNLLPAGSGSVTLNADNSWEATINDLPVYNGSQKIDYSWSEVVPENYKLTNTATEGLVTTLTNTFVTSRTVKKVWDDGENADNARPASLTVNLLPAGSGSVTLNADNSWEATIANLPVYDGSQKIDYSWSEVVPENYKLTNTATEGLVTTLTNTYLTSLTVKKVWDDADDQDGKRPESLKVTLSNGQFVTLSDSNHWTDKIEHLPKYKNGVEITYTWTEDTLPEGYTLTNTGKEGTITTLTNSYTPEETEATVKKVWDDAGDQDGKRPESLKVTLSNGTEVTLNDGNNWTAKVEHLPKYKDQGTEISYTWTEDTLPDGYTLTNTGKEGTITTLTNSYTPEETEATVKKVWDDANDQDGKRPESLKVTLSNGTEVTLNDGNSWTAKVEHLPKYKDHGTEISYTWTEDTLPDGYTLTNTGKEGTITTLTNSYTPEETEATVKKVWDDANDQDGKRPEFLKVNLLPEGSGSVTLNDANNWTAKVEHLPKYKDHGTEITYTWTEDTLPEGYTLTNTGKEGTITTLTNSYTPEETEATVKKVWDDANDQDGKRPESLKVTLSNGAEVTLSESNNWTAKVEHLPKYKDHGTEISYTWTEDTLPDGYELTDTSVDGKITILTNSIKPEETEATVIKVWDDMNNLDNIRPASLTVTLSNGTDVTLNKDNEWKATVTGLPKYENGQEIKYTWTEKDLPEGYRLKSTVVNGTVTTLTNIHTPPLLVSTSVSKQWHDEDNRDGSRPETLTVTLLVDGEASQKFVLSEENEWYAEVTNLPRLDDTGRQIAYTWKEETVPGYVDTAIVNGTHTQFINTHQPEMTSVTVVKIWDDKDDALEKRPVSIVMTLSNGTTVTLNERNHWKATISNLPTYDHGKKIEYSWTEQKVLDYVQTDKTVKGNTTYFTNALYSTPDEPPPGKPPKNPGPPTEYIPEYDTPLGVEVLINHVGDCFD